MVVLSNVNRWCTQLCLLSRTRLIPKERRDTFRMNPQCRNIATFSSEEPTLDLEYLTDPNNTEEIRKNIQSRKGIGCVTTVSELYKKYTASKCNLERSLIWTQLIEEARKIPNKSDPCIHSYGELPHIVATHGEKPKWDFRPSQLHDIVKHMGILRTENLGNLTGHRSYYFIDELVLLEQALIQYAVEKLVQQGFQLFSVPDLLHRDLIESCGMDTKGERTQVYLLDPRNGKDICLSGTAEMALASYFSGKTLSVGQLPIKVAAVSRCYRAETSNVQEEKGIYRVHQFTKVEMFGITAGDVSASDDLLGQFVSIERELFEGLGLHYQVLDMPPHELGAPAYRKFDVEAWMAGRGIYGEISSASNCTDYQARRLGIRTIDAAGQRVSFAHTVNGTACAVPRMMIALLETNQLMDGQVAIPKILQPYCRGLERLSTRDQHIKLQWIKSKTRQSRM